MDASEFKEFIFGLLFLKRLSDEFDRKRKQLQKKDFSHITDPALLKEVLPSDNETLASLIAKCREKTWPHLKNSTRQHYEFFTDKYLLPAWGTMKLRKLNVIELRDFFNSFHPRLSPKSIRLMHACMRVHLNQAKVWEMIGKNPAIGVKLPRKKQRRPTILGTYTPLGRVHTTSTMDE